MRERAVAKASDPGTNVRLPADLMKKIDRSALAAGRSRNTEILMRLRASYDTDERHSVRRNGEVATAG